LKWTIQKNRQNGEILWCEVDCTHPALCLIMAIVNLIARTRSCGQPDNLPMTVYKNRQ
jgi:hypothetical protein